MLGLLSSKQKRVLDAITEYIDTNGVSPTVREIGDILGIKSTSTVQGYLIKLQSKGYITKQDTLSRTIRVVK